MTAFVCCHATVMNGMVAQANPALLLSPAKTATRPQGVDRGIADAKLDSIPLVAITGQAPRSMIGTDTFPEVDTCDLTIPITKHNDLVKLPAAPGLQRRRHPVHACRQRCDEPNMVTRE